MPFVTPPFVSPDRGAAECATGGYARARLFAGLAARGTAEAAHEAAGYITSPDAALRNEAITALQEMGALAEAEVDALLLAAAPGTRLLAIEVTRTWPPERAAPRLARLLTDDPHPNVCAAAVDVAAETCTAALLPVLAPALAAARARFTALPFLRFAIDIASARLATGGPAS